MLLCYNVIVSYAMTTSIPRNANVVRGIMAENEPNIFIADKSIKFGRDVCFGMLIYPDVFWHHKNEEEYIEYFQLFTYTKFNIPTQNQKLKLFCW